MRLVLLTYRFYIPSSHSLKDKRRVIKSLKDTIKTRFNVSVSEFEHQELWQRAGMAIAIVASDGIELEKVMGAIERTVLDRDELQIVSFERRNFL